MRNSSGVHRKRTAIFFREPVTGSEPAREWLETLRDQLGQAAIFVRIARAESGNFGDWKSVGGGVMEMRIPVGSGYRVYYALEGSDVILLLVTGDKSTQEKDIQTSKEYWAHHRTRNKRG